MYISIEELKKIIREEVERSILRSAGFFGGVGSRSRKGVIIPPHGLGTEEKSEEYVKEKEQQFTQIGARLRDQRKRNGNARRNR